MRLIQVICPNCGAIHWHDAGFVSVVVKCLNCNPPTEYIIPRETTDED